MSSVPFIFANQTGPIPLSELDFNFANVKAFVDTAGQVTANVQSNITAVGTLSSLTVSGNATVNGNIIVGANILGTLSSATQANITSVGTLGNLTVTGTVTTGGNVNAANLSATLISGLLTSASQVNITAVGNLIALAVTGNVTAGGNVTANYFIGDGSQLTGITTEYNNSNVTSLLAAFGSNTISTTGNVSVGNIAADNVLTSTTSRFVYVSNAAPTSGDGAVGDIWYQTY